jgi:glycosyltransferase involved in cell wall biosynthesis
VINTTETIYVFIPAFNEEETIESVIDELKQLNLELKIYVIDDGSSDKTAEKARRAGAEVIRHPINLGGGAAVRTAFTIALKYGAQLIVTLDADGQHDPRELPKLLKAISNDKADFVIASRFLTNDHPEMPAYRRLGIKLFSWLISKKTGSKITDATSCYRVYRRSIIEKILPELRENQYYGLETIMKIAESKAQIAEVSSESRPRKKGKSKKGIIKYGYNLLRTLIKA